MLDGVAPPTEVTNPEDYIDRAECAEDLNKSKTKTPWPESASELYRASNRRLSAKLVPTFADRGLHVDSVTNPVISVSYTDKI
jgi:hypothetical protein